MKMQHFQCVRERERERRTREIHMERDISRAGVCETARVCADEKN